MYIKAALGWRDFTRQKKCIQQTQYSQHRQTTSSESNNFTLAFCTKDIFEDIFIFKILHKLPCMIKNKTRTCFEFCELIPLYFQSEELCGSSMSLQKIDQRKFMRICYIGVRNAFINEMILTFEHVAPRPYLSII